MQSLSRADSSIAKNLENGSSSSGSYYPFRWIPLSEEETLERKRVYNGMQDSSAVHMLRSQPGKVIMPRSYK